VQDWTLQQVRSIVYCICQISGFWYYIYSGEGSREAVDEKVSYWLGWRCFMELLRVEWTFLCFLATYHYSWLNVILVSF